MCGMQTGDDCEAAVDTGATLLGFNFWPQSKRYISPSHATLLTETVPAPVLRVGVFVDASADEVAPLLDTVHLALVQFHGNESPSFCRSFHVPFMKAFRLRDAATLAQIPDFLDGTDAPFLVDAYVPGEMGGTGTLAPGSLAKQAADLSTRMFLAGGLNATNVEAAIEAIGPWGVDVASGIEDSTGRKDRQAMDAFVQAVRHGQMEATRP